MNIKEMVIESYRKEGAKDERARIRQAQRAAIKELRDFDRVHLGDGRFANQGLGPLIRQLDAATKARRNR